MRDDSSHKVDVTILPLATHEKVILHQARNHHERGSAGERVGLGEALVGDLVPDASGDLFEEGWIAL